MLKPTLKFMLLATAATLTACGGGSVSSPGDAGPVTIVPPAPPPPPPPPPPPSQTADVDLVPGDSCTPGTTLEVFTPSGPGTTATSVEACVLSGTITSDLTLDPSIGYALSGAVFVGIDTGDASGGTAATLTIPAGTTIHGRGTGDYLVVSRGSKLNVEGEAANPVIMTSLRDVQGVADSLNDRGEWGGVVINGFAPINRCIDATVTPGTAGCERSGEGSSGLYGGGDTTDNSGSIEYLQVRYAGEQINSTDELNGIAFQAVGSGTTCNHIQVHNNQDDGVEFFGGNVQCDFVVLSGNDDDSLDWTDGWQGGAQRVLIVHTEGAGDQGIEADNRSSNNGATPISDPTIANFTFVGRDGDIGVLAREGTNGLLANGIIVDFPEAGIDVDNDSTLQNLAGDTLDFASIFLDNPVNILADAGESVDVPAEVRSEPNIVEGTSTLSSRFFPGSAESAVPATDVSTVAGFEFLDYVGAFSPDEDEQSNWATGWTSFIFEAPTDCPEGTADTNTTTPDGQKVCGVTGTLTGDVRLSNAFAYELQGAVFVGTDQGSDPAAPIAGRPGGTLTIDAGTVLYGATQDDYLVVSRGSELRVNGTASRPVVMTSRKEVFGEDAGGVAYDPVNDRGEWGGVVINGRAPINRCIDATVTPGTTGCERSGEGSSGLYGGGTSDDTSGTLNYLRVSFAGSQINSTDELNGIAFQGVGSGTTVEYVQVHNNVDDGVEFFGGNVNAKYLVLTGIGDDSIDWTDGWQGNLQYAIVHQADGEGDQGIEADNRSSNNDVLPRSNPTLSNLTLIGGSTGDIGMLLREGTAGDIFNSIVTDFGQSGFDVDGTATVAQVTAGELAVASSVIAGNAQELSDDTASSPEQAALANGGGNRVGGDVTDFRARPVGGDRYAPGASQNDVAATDVSTVDDFFDSVDFIGAVESDQDDWYQGWTLLVDQRSATTTQ